jgi:phosphoglycerate dehydrogenase-like enzyme
VEVVHNDGHYPMHAADLAAWLGDAEAAIIGLDEVSEALFAACPALRMVARNGVGMDTVDLDAATRHGVIVTAPLGANSTSVAELAFGLLIALARHVVPTHNRVQGGHWQRVMGAELAGKTLGIVGLGRIGKKVARRALAFNMRVIANDIAPDRYFAHEHQIPMLSFDAVLRDCDVLSLHVPLTPLTKHMIDRTALAAMKPGSLIVNTARGAVIDTAALVAALASGHIAGAALDVHPVEGVVDASLIDRPNVITTTHLGAYTRESLVYTTEAAVQSIIELLDGTCPSGIANPAVWTEDHA